MNRYNDSFVPFCGFHRSIVCLNKISWIKQFLMSLKNRNRSFPCFSIETRILCSISFVFFYHYRHLNKHGKPRLLFQCSYIHFLVYFWKGVFLHNVFRFFSLDISYIFPSCPEISAQNVIENCFPKAGIRRK